MLHNPQQYLDFLNRFDNPSLRRKELNIQNQLRYLTPGQMKVVEDMEKKISKIGFETKMRAVYVARKEVFKTERGVAILKGAINQFNSPTSNSIVEKSSSSSRNPVKKAQKQTDFLKAYSKRKIGFASPSFVLNIEELATLWHFPMSHVKTPMVEKVKTRVTEPPAGLPMDNLPVVSAESTNKSSTENGNRPSIKNDMGEEIYFDDF